MEKIAPITVKLRHLLVLYAVIPIAWIVVGLDKWVWGSALLFSIPFRPEMWAVWTYLFGMPHVLASMHTLVDREYLTFYGWKLLWIAIFFLALPFVVADTFGDQAMFAIFMAFIVYHTIAQQFGIALAAMRQKPGVLFGVWKWGAVGMGMALYAMIYSSPIPIAIDMLSPYRAPLTIIAGGLLSAFLVATVALLWRVRGNRIGMAHIGANAAMIATEFALFQQGYFAFVVILGRVIHEFTAWPIYATHDHNRNLAEPKNMLFKAFGFARIPPYVLSILLACALGFALTYSLELLSIAAPLLVSLSLIHYYSESFLWKRGSIHRRHLSFSA